ncbi:MAG: adenosine kinase [Bacteroidales bacterium]|nr:adenosine kinase [Lentimicrobiaceae bacterium]MDD5695507.1 adenosine kinase [Bacteroidales bacterium]
MSKILGIGNALVDIIISLEDDHLLKEFHLPKGSMQLVDRAFSDHILNETGSLRKTIASGGSCANTIHGLASLGVETGFIGKICHDEFGTFFLDELRSKKVRPFLFFSPTETGRAISLVSPDKERTFATFLGAAMELVPENLVPNLFNGYDIIHFEGYLVQNHALLLKAMELARQNQLKISLDLASYNVVEENHDFLISIVNDYVDILFANEDEAKAFTGLLPQDALDRMAQGCDVAVIKMGKLGSWIRCSDAVIPIQPHRVDIRDTTGAGDLYAAGFLYGLANRLPLEKCGLIASYLASRVIETEGAKIPENKWREIRKTVEGM